MNKNVSKIVLLISILSLSSCGTVQRSPSVKTKEPALDITRRANSELNPANKVAVASTESSGEPVFSRSSTMEITEIEKSALEEDLNETEQSQSVVVTPTNAFEETLNLRYSSKLFNWWISFFTKREKERFNRHLNNGIKYKKLIKSIFREHGLPSDLYYVGLIESGFNTYVRSRAGATGPWQFMRGTGRNYGLRVDSAVDERANLVKSTHAAARYFKDLYNIFSSWELALCAYNAGEYRIIGAIRRGNSRDYRELVKKKLLPKETIYYIPKVAAAKAIIDAPEKFGFQVDYNAPNPYEKHQIKNVPYSFNSRQLAKAIGVPYKTFKELNPDIRHANVKVRSKRRGHDILVPEGLKTTLAEARTTGEVQYIAPKSSRSSSRSKASSYKVRRGDNLYKIAKRLGISVSTLKSLNNIRGSKILVGQRLRTKGRSIASTPSSGKSSSSRTAIHKVRRGENLTLIARRYGTSVAKLNKLNRFKRKVLFVGQRVKVPYKEVKRYTVRRGDNLNKIANKFGVTVSMLKQANNLRSSRIFAGQKVVIPSNG